MNIEAPKSIVPLLGWHNVRSSLPPIDRQVAPACRASDAQRDDRQCGDLHRPQLRVAGYDQCLSSVVLRSIVKDLRKPAQHDPTEPGPVLVVAIDLKGGMRV